MSLKTPPERQTPKPAKEGKDGELKWGEAAVKASPAAANNDDHAAEVDASKLPKKRLLGIKEASEKDLMWKVNVSTSKQAVLLHTLVHRKDGTDPRKGCGCSMLSELYRAMQ